MYFTISRPPSGARCSMVAHGMDRTRIARGANMAGTSGHRGWGHIRRLPSGRYQASYVGPDGQRHRAPMTYTKRADADGWLADERRHVERDSRGIAEWTPPREREAARWERGETLAVYGERWIKERP